MQVVDKYGRTVTVPAALGEALIKRGDAKRVEPAPVKTVKARKTGKA